MQFRILGPVEVCADGERLAIGGPQQRGLLAVLLLNANRVVSADRLIAELWGDQPPPDARALLRGCVLRLRRALDSAGPPTRVQTRPPGYLVEVQPGELDLDRFEELERAARQAMSDGTRRPAPDAATRPAPGGAARPALELAAARLHEALALWRGPPLDDLPPDTCRADAARLAECRLAALSERIDTDLYLGRHERLVDELELHVRTYPLRERLWAQYLVTLHAVDRPTEALAAYRRLRELLVEQLGVEPGATLRNLERAILTDADPLEVYRQAYGGPAGSAVPAAAALAVPAQLPADVAGFTGRAAQLKQLGTALGGEPTTVVITAIAGTAGVGKTALALHWAHRVRDRFPDGQLYVNLRGYAPTPPMGATEVLAGFLEALGVPADRIPPNVERAAALYRSLLADRRVLVLLDNARSAEQVRPLLPGSAGCVVLVTSRDRLGGLIAHEGAQRLVLGVLAPDEARGLVARILSHDRASSEPEAVATLTRLCAYLPLALRIAAAALVDAPSGGIATYVDELTEGSRLAALTVDGDEHTGVRATFDSSYAALAPEARRLFRLLGLVPGPDITPEAAAALADRTGRQARTLLDRLAGAHLLAESAPGRFTCHDLLRAYAADVAARTDSATDRHAAVARLAHWYLSTVDSAARAVYPNRLRLPVPDALPVPAFATEDDAMAWLDAERANLVATIESAAAHGPRPAAWRLTDALRSYFWLRTNTVDWPAVAATGLAASEAEGDEPARAAANLCLADAYRSRSRFPEAIEHYRRALALHEPLGAMHGVAACLTNLGNAYRESGYLAEAADHYRRALAVDERLGRIEGRAATTTNLGLVYHEQGRLRLAARHHRRAMALNAQAGSRHGEAVNLGNLAQEYHGLGRLDEARACLGRAIAVHRTFGDHGAEAENLRILAEVERDAGRLPEARRAADEAVRLAVATGDQRYEAEAWSTLGSVDERLARYADALAHHRRGLDLAREIGAHYAEVTALVGLAVAYAGAGEPAESRAHAERAAALAAERGYQVLEGQALTAVADVLHAVGEPAAARASVERAQALLRDTGHRLGRCRAQAVLDRIDAPPLTDGA
jgi:DNA-binding SARP family transcriptional activator/tetratricopeptide (TPR) repeat protein